MSQSLRCIAFSGPHKCAPVPIFALVRNDMQKHVAWVRLQGRGSQ